MKRGKRRIILQIGVIYLVIGFLFSIFFGFLPDLKTFDCNTPDGSYGAGGVWTPPEKTGCQRRAFTAQEFINGLTVTILWLPLIGMKIIGQIFL